MEMIERWSRWLRQRIFSDRFVVQTKGGIEVLQSENLGNLWVVGRDCCVFKTLPVQAVPANKIDAVVSAQIPLLSPFGETSYWFTTHNSEAKIWLWDEAARKSAADESGAGSENYQVIPEACFADRITNGSIVSAAKSGFFAQVWQDGELQADAWWPELPDHRSWRTFTRSVGAVSADMPEAVDLYAQEPSLWSDVKRSWTGGNQIELRAVAAIAAVFLVVFAFQLTESLRVGWQHWQLESEIDSLRSTHAEVLSLRDRAFKERSTGDRLEELDTVRQISLLNSVAEVLPAGAGKLVIWQYDAGGLEFVVEDPSPDLEDYVRRLEAISYLGSVSVETIPRQQQIRIITSVVES